MSSSAREVFEAVVLALVVFLVVQATVQNFRVEGSSMYPNLQDGQYLLVNKLVYFRVDQERLSRIIPFWQAGRLEERFAIHPPQRGDVIVFQYPRDTTRDFVKRVIGVPGDEVEMRRGAVYVNGAVVQEPYLQARDVSDLKKTSLGVDEYFVLGDNRSSSNDSRAWGVVPTANILGKAWFIYWPPGKWHPL
ncbi:MAG: signal peptidase I [Dehalococcoidia bacterium]|nr:signal peptidase I [Dehalococcoidia bacterium]MSQ17158.1 signal peptidase I [Dehalococcoidia bacterium]